MIVKTAANLQNSPLSYILFFVNKTKNVDNPTVIHKLLINLPRVLLFFLRLDHGDLSYTPAQVALIIDQLGEPEEWV